jgi:hypothetical protein
MVLRVNMYSLKWEQERCNIIKVEKRLMKEIYEKLELDVVKFEKEENIYMSGVNGGNPDQNGTTDVEEW